MPDTFQQYADKTFNDFLNAARAQGIEAALFRAENLLNAVEREIAAKVNDDDKLLVAKTCSMLRYVFEQDKARFRVLYQDELAMAVDVLKTPAKH
jgi:hypothetical protein